ncbi:hypothetical protein JD844_010558 [Phrynosoma platyrhinos]|uniref:Uncharacterized protein n=1 Tax=Phrynosoma platyrhinos TaxID=52577 RepID=A0ABQ7TGN6_PHRPL|nr:hypothetical protein JD844_010558 [Phrynosoma platyrhinos]
MDNDLFWDSLPEAAIEGTSEKKKTSKFKVIHVSLGKVILRNWKGVCLAPVEVGTDPKTFPVLPVQYSEDPSLEFKVFHRGNKVAFQAHNGLFLARKYRRSHVLEAATFPPDDTCFFHPLIGDLLLPTFEIMNVNPRDLSQVKCRRCLLDRQTYFNRSKVPIRHTFTMAWDTHCTDRIVWNRLWGLGLPSSCSFTVKDATPTVSYTEDNEYIISVSRHILETITKEVVVPPRTKATASLWVKKHNDAAVPFTAFIGKVKPDGEVVAFNEGGAWTGLVYHGLHMEVTMEGLHKLCTVM